MSDCRLKLKENKPVKCYITCRNGKKASGEIAIHASSVVVTTREMLSGYSSATIHDVNTINRVWGFNMQVDKNWFYKARHISDPIDGISLIKKIKNNGVLKLI